MGSESHANLIVRGLIHAKFDYSNFTLTMLANTLVFVPNGNVFRSDAITAKLRE